MDVDSIAVGTTTGVDGGRADTVEGNGIPTDAGVTADVEPSVDIGRDNSSLGLMLSSFFFLSFYERAFRWGRPPR